MIVGIDEVGRGPWAGPLVVGAVVLGDATIEGLTDSKQLSKKRREVLSAQILNSAASFGLGWVMADELDRIGLSAALTTATIRALEQIHVPYHEIIIDGTVNFLQETGKGQYVTTLKKADLLISAVSAASIIAKVARDDYMAELDTQFTGYNFESHAGYGTAGHSAAIEQFGITIEHRKSFAPIAKLISRGEPLLAKSASATTNKASGERAESVVAAWLEEDGFIIIERNWKTKYCEIDIIASKDSSLLFVEVKHRKRADQGGGIAAITPRKERQMNFAARLYLASKRHTGDAQLAVVTTTGTDSATIEQFLLIE